MVSPKTKRLSAIIPFIIALTLCVISPRWGWAQQSKSLPPHMQKKLQQLREHQSSEQPRASSSKLQPVQSSVDYSSIDGMFTTFEQDQSWNLNPNPNPQQNFALFGQGQPAGNVNGDSTNGNPVKDYIVTGQARDENTSALYDQTWKTAVFFGGNTSGTPDQIIDRKLIPVGDLNGDGYADAVASEVNLQYPSTQNQAPYIYKGSASGYKKTSKLLDEGFNSRQKQIGFKDFNRDGYEDIVSYYPDADDVFITWGAPLFSDVTFTVYSSVLVSGPKRLVVEDVDQDTLKEIVTFSGILGDGQIQISEVDTTAQSNPSTGIQQQQMFGFSAFSGYADDFGKALHLVDINGSGYPEIFISTGQDTSKYVFEYDSTNSQYNTSAINFFDGRLVPAGDLNNDGMHDFIQGDASGNAYISYGTADLSAPGRDYPLSGNSSTDWDWDMQYNPYSDFGDLTGDGVDDALLSHTEQSGGSITLGRRILQGSGSESYSSIFHQYSHSNFFSSIAGTEEIGDINGDGIEDFAMGGDQRKIFIFYGGSSISQSPDKTLNLSFRPNGITSGDFTGNGTQDIIVIGRDDQKHLLKVYEGSSLSSVKTIYASDFQSADRPDIYGIQNIGDVNADGAEDFITGSSMALDSTSSGVSYLNEAYVFYGGGTISSSPDATIPFGSSSSNYAWAGETATPLGDINGDGVDDFAVSAAYVNNDDGTMGQVYVMYGGSSKTFSSPDMVLRPEKIVRGFGWGLSTGDFTGDGSTDLAVSALNASAGELEPPTAIHIYYGDSGLDNQADQFLTLPNFVIYQSSLESSGTSRTLYGTLETISDFTNDGKDELLFSSSYVMPNHAALYTFNTGKSNPTSVLRAPNKAAGLGGMTNMATGDFTNNGEVDVVLSQPNDNNDAYRSSRVYRFGLPRPITITNVEDVPDDQGRRIRIHTGGFLMKAMNRDIYGMDSWSVWRMTKDSSWTNVKTVSPSSEDAGFVDVTVNKTQPTGVDSIDNSYTFRLEAFSLDKGGVIARSDTASGMALDNISPPTVQSVGVSDQNGDKLVSWQPSEANDVGQYLVYSADASGQPTGSPVGASSSTNFTLPNSFSGVQNFVVKARDVNNNMGPGSAPASAIYPKIVGYDMNTGWNLIGLPVDASVDSIQAALSDAINIYEYNGGYNQVDQLEAGKGYWAKFTQQELTQLGGLPVTQLSLDLHKGWNLISGVGGELPVASIGDPDGIVISGTIYAYKQSYSATDTLQPGQGYWLRASDAGTVTFTHPKLVAPTASNKSADEPMAKQQQDITKSFSSIVVGDGTHDRTLYFGGTLPDQADKRSFSLPPIGPGQMFDARFTKGGRLVEKAEGRILLNRLDGTSLHIKITPHNMAEASQFVVRELADGQVLSEYTVEADKQVTLKHSETSAIFVAPAGNAELSQNEVPEKFKLEQNYPNPFNPTTQIEYSITEASTVKLEVFNILGKRVATLINEQKKPGHYEVTFDGSNLASGVYLYRLQAGSHISTKKFILAK